MRSTVPDNTGGEPPRFPPYRRRRDPLGPDSELGARLRALYATFEEEPIPADIIDLLEQLDDAERGGADQRAADPHATDQRGSDRSGRRGGV